MHGLSFILASILGLVSPVVADVESKPTGNVVPSDARQAKITLASGATVAGKVYLTRGKRLRVWDPRQRRYRDFSISQLSRIEVRVTRERIEKEWRFKEEGSDEKVFTGRTYTRLDFDLRLTLAHGRRLDFKIAKGTPVYMETPQGKRRRFLIQPFMKGEVGQQRSQLVYPKEILFTTPREPVKESVLQEQAPRGQGRTK